MIINSNIEQFYLNSLQMDVEKLYQWNSVLCNDVFVFKHLCFQQQWGKSVIRTCSFLLFFFCVCMWFLCRLLETDSKSLRSVNGSRRNSGSSLVSSSSASSNLSHLEEDSWILWGRIVNEWEDVRKKKEKQVKVVGHICRIDL